MDTKDLLPGQKVNYFKMVMQKIDMIDRKHAKLQKRR